MECELVIDTVGDGLEVPRKLKIELPFDQQCHDYKESRHADETPALPWFVQYCSQRLTCNQPVSIRS